MIITSNNFILIPYLLENLLQVCNINEIAHNKRTDIFGPRLAPRLPYGKLAHILVVHHSFLVIMVYVFTINLSIVCKDNASLVCQVYNTFIAIVYKSLVNKCHTPVSLRAECIQFVVSSNVVHSVGSSCIKENELGEPL